MEPESVLDATPSPYGLIAGLRERGIVAIRFRRLRRLTSGR